MSRVSDLLDRARVAAGLEEDFTPEARRRMETWRREQPRDKHGRHEYDPVDFGLDTAQIREQFRFYSDRFHVPMGKD